MDHSTDDLMESVAGIGFIVFGIVFWVAVSAAVGKIARCKGYNFFNWFLACVFLTPPSPPFWWQGCLIAISTGNLICS